MMSGEGERPIGQRCARCGHELVQVDNPFRKEFRHKRGQECAMAEQTNYVKEFGPFVQPGDAKLHADHFNSEEVQAQIRERKKQEYPDISVKCKTCGSSNSKFGALSCSDEFHLPRSKSDPRWVRGEERRAPEEISLETPSDADRKAVSLWADSAMFRSEPMPTNESGRVVPKAYLLNATPDPLGSLAALNAIYTGTVRRNLGEVTDEERREALVEVRKNKLQGPLESIEFHFLLEGVSRAFTHQIVRGRHAFYGQESLRFAVVEGERWQERCATPPGFEFWTELQQDNWNDAIINAQIGYDRLVESGIPAEDARGLMPHAMTTRIHWVCTLRELLYVAGVRLCTQAQFEWRSAMASVVQALREHQTLGEIEIRGVPEGSELINIESNLRDGWQFEAMADLLRPVCYQEGACGFKSKYDRTCSIRERVDFREKHSFDHEDSSNWDKPMIADVVEYGAVTGHAFTKTVTSPGIDPAEWLTDPNAAR